MTPTKSYKNENQTQKNLTTTKTKRNGKSLRDWFSSKGVDDAAALNGAKSITLRLLFGAGLGEQGAVLKVMRDMGMEQYHPELEAMFKTNSLPFLFVASTARAHTHTHAHTHTITDTTGQAGNLE